MNKNLKKVISAVATVALSASSFAAFAIDFPDVEPTNVYAQAVSELASLGVISGVYEGDSVVFKPDDLVTRAEITKMIVDAKNMGALASASSGSTKFADANGHWATGYINQGVADGWISGYSSTEFGPDDKVTFMQAQRMLVSALGYDSYAQAQGGWPSGYQAYAGQLNITSGVYEVTSADQQLTRGQVAQMIDNAMNAPITRVETYAWGYPVYETLNKTNKNYQTMFTYYHKAYKVYGRVTGTSKTSEGSVDTNKVSFKVERADNFDDVTYKSSSEKFFEDNMYFGDTNAPNMLRTYAQALIQKDDNDEFTILSIVAAASDKSVTVNAEDIDDENSSVAKGALYFYPAGTSRGALKYPLDTDVDYYVNGVEMGKFDDAALQKYIVENESATVTLQKVSSTGSTSGTKYNVVMITTYGTAVVSEVIEKSDTITIAFDSYSFGKSRMEIQKDDENYTYSFKLDGVEIDPTDIKENDVLSISYNTADFAKSTFYDVLVSRDTATGSYSGKNGSGEYTFDGTKYKLVKGMDLGEFQNLTTYTLYLDYFGKVAAVEEVSSTKKIGILKSVNKKYNDDWVAEIITKDGDIVEYNIDTKKDAKLGEKYKELVKGDNQPEKVANYKNQVVAYKTTSAGLTISETKDKEGNPIYVQAPYAVCDYKTYRESTSRLGNIKVSDASVILDISNAGDKKDDIKVVSKDDLKDGAVYQAYGYEPSTTDKACKFILITDGVGGIDSTSQLSIFVEAGKSTDADGSEINTMTLINNGEEITLNVDVDADVDVDDFAEGDALVYSVNSVGDIDHVISVFGTTGTLDGTTYGTFKEKMLKGATILNPEVKDWPGVLGDEDEDEVDIIFGAVVKDGSSYVVAPINEDGTVDIDGADSINLSTASAKIYAYNFKQRKSNGSRILLDEGMRATDKVKEAYNENETVYNLNHPDVENVVFAVARTFNGDDAQEVYLIYND
ncbi:MAG: S-layer homology domain-containing protein [Oscillospiraceae bacterium]|nr:S-layer homology domain-containing protein [Oscillospiraceae bacterium]